MLAIVSLAWKAADRGPVVAVGTVVVAFLVYHYGLSVKGLAKRLAEGGSGGGRSRGGSEAARARAVLGRRLLGGILFGGASIAGAALATSGSLAPLGLRLGSVGWGAGGVLALYAALVPILARAAHQPAHQAIYPALRLRPWTLRVAARNAGTWVFYLVGYELLFRGLLLGLLVAWGGVWPGIAITTALYALAHLPAPAEEAVATVPMGVAFALLVLVSGAIWPAIALHAAIAITSDALTARASPAADASRRH